MKTKTGIYGGTYAPVHNGHIRAAVEFKKQFCLDRLLIIPCCTPPHKEMPKGDSAEHRLNMLNLAFSDYEGIEISSYEIEKEGKSYSVETLRHFYNDETELYFLCGTDMLLCMHQWYKAEEIAKLATLVYARRENDANLDEVINKQIKMLKTNYGFKIEKLELPALEISSTQVRNACDKSLYLSKEVDDYIRKYRLYEQ